MLEDMEGRHMKDVKSNEQQLMANRNKLVGGLRMDAYERKWMEET